MNLRALIVLLALINSVSFGAGGVDVGNGGTSRVVEVLIDEGFSLESELSNHLSDNKLGIEQGTYLSLGVLTRQYECSREIKIEEMEVKNHYPLTGTNIGVKEFQGLLKLELQNCKKQ